MNAPRCPFRSFHRDGAMRTDGNLGATASYWPNSVGAWGEGQGAPPPLPLDGDAAHWDHRVDDDHFEQPGILFRGMDTAQREALFGNTARSLGDAPRHVKQRHVDNCRRADPAYGDGVAAALGMLAVEI